MKLTQEQLAELIAKVFANIDAKRKSSKEDGEISTDEIIAEVSAILEEMDAGEGDGSPTDEGDGAVEGEKAEDGTGAESPVNPEFIAQVIAALGGMKSAEGAEETKTAETGREVKSGGPSATGAGRGEPQRKYAGLFLSRGAGRDIGAQTGFKARMESMSAPERRRAAYGMFGRAVKCINASGGDMERAAHTAEHLFKDAEMAHEFKALSSTSPTDGGYLVPEVYANEIIELLYPATIIYSLGARRLGMANGNLNIPKIKTGSRALFTGETRAIPNSAPKFGNLKLSAKKLTALIPMSNDLLRSTNFDNDVIVGQDVTKQMALGVDWALCSEPAASSSRSVLRTTRAS